MSLWTQKFQNYIFSELLLETCEWLIITKKSKMLQALGAGSILQLTT